MKVVATETDGDSAVLTAVEKKPDLILLDVSLGGVSGIDVARNLFSSWKEARVLAVSAHANSIYVRGMIKVGARGYMLKDNGPREIANAITTIMEGGQWIGEGSIGAHKHLLFEIVLVLPNRYEEHVPRLQPVA